MQLYWVRCQGDVWCPLNSVNLNHEHFADMNGVYLIWHGGEKPQVAYVGQGEIKKRIAAHRNNQDIQQYQQFGLYVTWARLSEKDRNGVERYLAQTWKPKVGNHDHLGNASPIPVNSPWD